MLCWHVNSGWPKARSFWISNHTSGNASQHSCAIAARHESSMSQSQESRGMGGCLDRVVLRVWQGEGADEDANGHGCNLGQIRRGGHVVERGAHAAGVAVPPVPHDKFGAGQRRDGVLPIQARLKVLHSRP